jgi:hypothetical protein
MGARPCALFPVSRLTRAPAKRASFLLTQDLLGNRLSPFWTLSLSGDFSPVSFAAIGQALAEDFEQSSLPTRNYLEGYSKWPKPK